MFPNDDYKVFMKWCNVVKSGLIMYNTWNMNSYMSTFTPYKNSFKNIRKLP